MRKQAETVYYSDESEEFSGKNIKVKKPIDKNYKYISNNIFYKFFSFILYRIIAPPVAFIYVHLIKRIKVENKGVLKKFKKSGYFVYANHTNQFSDVFTPQLISYPRKTYVIVAPENVNLPVLGNATKMMGALPIPTKLDGMRNFINAIEKRILQGGKILIYPEAHLWPYYTGIRNFSSTSFRYPVRLREPCFAFTTTYQQGRSKKKPKIVVYVDGPFYPDRNLDDKASQEKLRDEIYNTMCERAKMSNFELVKYVKKEKTK